MVVPVGAVVGRGDAVGVTVGEGLGEVDAPGSTEQQGEAGSIVGDGEERSGVASSDGTASDSSVVGSGVAGVPSAPTDGEQAATSAARTMSASMINGLRAWRIMTCSPVRVPTCGQPRRGVCRPRLREVTIL